jgi:hypothetical protein
MDKIQNSEVTKYIDILDLSSISRHCILTKCKSGLSLSTFINLDYGLLGYNPEDGNNRFLENMGSLLTDCVVPCTRDNS